MQLQVKELPEFLAKRQEDTVTAVLNHFDVDDEATELIVDTGSEEKEFVLDEQAISALTKYLKVPTTYFEKLSPEFKATVLRYEFDRHKEAATTLEVLNGDIIAVHQPGKTMLPLNKVAGVITNVCNDDDTIRRIIVNENRFHVDVTSSAHQIEFPLNPQSPGAYAYGADTAAVGDITEAGMRILAYPFQAKRPSVGAYAERLICLNGQCTAEKIGAIDLKGRTVDEVCAEMEIAAELILGQLDDYLQRLAATRDMTVPGSPQAFAAQLAQEANLSRQVLDKVLEIVNQLPEPVTVWDINQAFTSVANDTTRYATMVRMQTLGGELGFDAQRMIERCNSCERLL